MQIEGCRLVIIITSICVPSGSNTCVGLNMEPISKVMVLSVLFQAFTTSVCRMCHFKIESSASRWVRKPCVFFFGSETKAKYIGSEFRFRDDASTKVAFEFVGVNFNEFVNSPLTLWNQSCDCTKVPCLNEEQLNNLFAFSIEQARKEATTRSLYFPNLCCSLQQVLEEIFFSLEAEEIANLTKIALTEIGIDNWTTYLSHELQQTQWCKSFKAKCEGIIHRIRKGCEDKKRERRDIGLKTTVICRSSSCIQGKKKLFK